MNANEEDITYAPNGVSRWSGQDLGNKNNANRDRCDVADQKLPTLRPGETKLVFVFLDFLMRVFCAPHPADENGGQHAA